MLLKQPNSDLLFSNVTGEAIPFSIGDPSVIIDIIRKKIYSYPIRTAVQEYLSNAKDAVVEAGKDSSNIRVDLPSQIKPEFVVRDFGIGMSDETVRDVFVRYGVSTKRNNNSQLGCFGIGAKSGWAVSDSFVIESFHEGTRREYIADIGDQREGRLLLFKETPTEEENGVLVKIPIKQENITEVKRSYLRTTWLWDKRPVNELEDLSKAYPECILDLDDVKVYYVNNTYIDSGVYLDANGIPFKCDNFTWSRQSIGITDDLIIKGDYCSNNGIAIVIKSEPWKMGISASREGFSNKDYATKKIKYAFDKISDYVSSEFKNNPKSTYFGLFQKYKLFMSLVSLFNGNYNIFVRSNLSENNLFLSLSHKIGYALNIKHNTRFRYSLSYSLKEGAKIYKSKSKGCLNREDNTSTPELLPETKKAITLAKNVDLQKYLALGGQLKRLDCELEHVFFQDNLSDAEYEEIAEILGATEYIEDAYKNVKLVRVKQEKLPKVEKPKKEITVGVFSSRHRYSSSCYRSGYQTLESLLDSKQVIFYGTECVSSLLWIIRSLPINAIVVHPGKLDLAAMDNPKLVPLTNFQSYVLNNKSLMDDLNDIAAIKKHKCTFRLIQSIYMKLKSELFDLEAIGKNLKNNLQRTDIISSDCESMFDLYKPKSILIDFSEKYYLLRYLSYYDSNDKELLSHVQNYINNIDRECHANTN